MSPALNMEAFGQYSVVILPALVIAEQCGIPLPAVPALLAFGALAAHQGAPVALALTTMAAVAISVDFAWYELGRRRGARILTNLCRVTLEPDFCVRRAQNIFIRYGVRAMLVAKFFPGITTILPPLAGVFAVSRIRFALYDLVGVWLWSGTWMAIGYMFSDAVAVIASYVTAVGPRFAIFAVLVLGGYIVVKYVRRRLYLRRIWMARISPSELKQRLDAGEDVSIIDLRAPLDIAAMPRAIPGSRWMDADHIDRAAAEFLRSRDIVLYCS